MRFCSYPKSLLTLLLSLMLSACVTTMPTAHTPAVNITAEQQVYLPTPDSLGYSLSASQLIEATWHNGKSDRTEQLPVQLQVTQDKLVLAGFSSWGTRILSLEYQGDKISSEVLTGLDGVLPAPEQVLFNLMITLWPTSAWEAPLNAVQWQILDTDNNRSIYNSDGKEIIHIQYSNKDKLSGKIIFHNLIDDYTITITTLQSKKTD
ncbi:hypothetical protein VHA01S_005_00840 [Vibrio halioticoli NBRC 102217]|uniref:Lipoprotein n=1 Tax=Vibrio halioticoli NBRC 102217 TaxID=1219072 RepID=V5FF32_9VIBR|nr:DUF3261 domain-containing protein [Vibrio halioticoli]GAD88481.1 hypothetical protein VHA01S_005_00840 [Vibrio halioticoli NBRC 102217]